MNIYRIRNKNTGKYFVWSANPSSLGQWNHTGVFWQRIDTAKKHIYNLMHEWRIKNGGVYNLPYCEVVRYAKEREGTFEIIVNNISVNDEKCISAEELLNGAITLKND